MFIDGLHVDRFIPNERNTPQTLGTGAAILNSFLTIENRHGILESLSAPVIRCLLRRTLDGHGRPLEGLFASCGGRQPYSTLQQAP